MKNSSKDVPRDTQDDNESSTRLHQAPKTSSDDAINDVPTLNSKTSALDLNSLRLPQNYEAMSGVTKLGGPVQVRKPHRQEFVRVHPDEAWRFATAAVKLKEEQDKLYILGPDVRNSMVGEFVPTLLLMAVTRQQTPFLWPIPLPGPDGKHNPWHRAAQGAANEAMSRWVRMAANMDAGTYDVHVATGITCEPIWPTEAFDTLVEVALADAIINDLDHPVLRRLRGEV